MSAPQTAVIEPRNVDITDTDRLRRILYGRARAFRDNAFIVTIQTAYQLAFFRRLDATLVQQIDEIISGDVRRRPGFIYAFWDRRENTNLIKVGRTRQAVRDRLEQWDAELGGGNNIVLLFAHKTLDNETAETVIATALRVEWSPKRINRLTRRRVVEVYRIDNVANLKIFVDLCTRYVTALVKKRKPAHN